MNKSFARDRVTLGNFTSNTQCNADDKEKFQVAGEMLNVSNSFRKAQRNSFLPAIKLDTTRFFVLKDQYGITVANYVAQ